MTKASPVTIAEAPVPIASNRLQFKPPIPIRFPSRRCLPAVWMRSGTSKGLFIHQRDLPASPNLWESILLSAMGSAQGNTRQIDGVGGATSTTSKAAIVAKSTRAHADVDYTFVQVAPDRARIDMTGTCGNMASGVGPFALDEGIVRAAPGQKEMDIQIFNTNTEQTIIETVQVSSNGSFMEEGDYRIPGVETPSSPIKLAFLHPGGSMTGKMFPSGSKKDILSIPLSNVDEDFSVRVSLVDAANPFVLVDASSLPLEKHPRWPDPEDPAFVSVVEAIRCEGAVRFGLAADAKMAEGVRGTPKVAFLSATASGDTSADIQVLAFSMGKPHASLQLTGAVCLGAAMAIHGTVAWEIAARQKRIERPPKHGMAVDGHEIASPCSMGIRHPAGVIHVETVLGMDCNGEVDVDKVAVFRTARRLFEGNVFYRDEAPLLS